MRRRHFVATALGCAAGLLPGVGRAATPMSAAYFAKMAAFDQDHDDDILLGAAERRLLRKVLRRLERVQATVGHGNFCVLGFDGMLKIARSYGRVGPFKSDELAFMERVFFHDARGYGFNGERVLGSITEAPRRRDLRRVPGGGHRLFAGASLDTFQRMRREVGSELVLTSGVRSIVKQFHLFLRKADRSAGNLSLASRSLAPPGYSYHGVGDFDVGQRGYGARNFTADFARTAVAKRMADLGYARVRYPHHNLLGVRYEPWHIRVLG